MISFFVWILMGAFVGWLASVVMKSNHRMGTLLNILVGIIGAAVGGALFRAFGFSGANINDGISLYSIIVSFIGAVVVIGLVQLISGRRR